MKPYIFTSCLLLGLILFLPKQSVALIEAPNLPLKKALLLDFKRKGGRAVSFCSTSQSVFIAFDQEDSRKVHRWDLRTGSEKTVFSAPRGYRCDSTAPSPDGKLLLVKTYDLVHDALNQIFKVTLVDTETGSIIKVLEYQENITFVQFSRDGQRFRVLPGLPDRFPGWEDSIFDRKGGRASIAGTNAFEPAESPVLAQGIFKDPALYYTAGGTKKKLVEDAFEFLSVNDETLLAASTQSGEVVIWQASDLKELFRSSFGKHPVWLVFDQKMNRFLVINGNDGEKSALYGIQIDPSR